MEIGSHLAKLQPKQMWHVFMAHGVLQPDLTLSKTSVYCCDATKNETRFLCCGGSTLSKLRPTLVYRRGTWNFSVWLMSAPFGSTFYWIWAGLYADACCATLTNFRPHRIHGMLAIEILNDPGVCRTLTVTRASVLKRLKRWTSWCRLLWT